MVMALALLAYPAASGQSHSTPADSVPASAANGRDNNFVCTPVFNYPSFTKGGDVGLIEWVHSRIKYPPKPPKGKLVVQFFITETGEVNPDSVRVYPKRNPPEGLAPEYVAQALSVFKSLPKFTPAYDFLQHKKVPIWMTLPVDYSRPQKKK